MDICFPEKSSAPAYRRDRREHFFVARKKRGLVVRDHDMDLPEFRKPALRTGLLSLNLNESAALEDFLLASLRFWTKRS